MRMLFYLLLVYLPVTAFEVCMLKLNEREEPL